MYIGIIAYGKLISYFNASGKAVMVKYKIILATGVKSRFQALKKTLPVLNCTGYSVLGVELQEL